MKSNPIKSMMFLLLSVVAYGSALGADYRVGDADLSGGAPDLFDAQLALEGVLGLASLDQISPLAYANDDGRFDVADVMLAAQSVNGLANNGGIAAPFSATPPADSTTYSSYLSETVSLAVSSPHALGYVEGLQWAMTLPVDNGEALISDPATVAAGSASASLTPVSSNPPESIRVQWRMTVSDSQGGAVLLNHTADTDILIDVPVCGDSVTQPNEACDDGNADPCDGCAADCLTVETCSSSYPVIDTPQANCYDDTACMADCPAAGELYYGQDAQYDGLQPAYLDVGDGTVEDLNTGFIWQQTPTFSRMDWESANAYCDGLALGGETEWRLPTLLELYSIADFNGALKGTEAESVPYLDEAYFDFQYDPEPDLYAGQYWSSTLYLKGPVVDANTEGAFGFNFADGHIKSYPTGRDFYTKAPTPSNGCYVRCVLGAPDVYGVADLAVYDADSVNDNATGMMWQRSDGGATRNWEEALNYCETLTQSGFSDWRLPSTKELHTIIDYDSVTFPALDTTYFTPTFDLSYGTSGDYGWYWTSTTFGDWNEAAIYFAVGRAYSTTDDITYTDWHGAGAQRSDPKLGTPSQSCSVNACDEERIDNYVLCVRSGNVTLQPLGTGEACPSGGGGGGVPMCAEVPPGNPCCGDLFCGGPETSANCPEDCP